MSALGLELDPVVTYEAPPALPVQVLATYYGEAIAVPDLVPVVEVAWQRVGRPGVFTASMAEVGSWQRGMDALLRLRVFELDSIYALLGGWPPPVPLEDQAPPPPAGDLPAE